jgi:FPC/CPF motif-containing protein YcgG
MLQSSDILTFNDSDWRREVFDFFSTDMTSETPAFPCVFGAAGFVKDQLRYIFLDDAEEQSIKQLSESLLSYLKIGRELGPYTSFIAFMDLERDKDIEEYERLFWNVLNRLHTFDPHEWPDHIPADPSDPKWEFSFASEPMFVVCNTPAHVLRRSRRSKTFMLTFQPRWVFAGVTQQQINYVRKLMKSYDKIPEFPRLGTYGESQNRSWMQYFIPDTNEVEPKRCPFHHGTNRLS